MYNGIRNMMDRADERSSIFTGRWPVESGYELAKVRGVEVICFVPGSSFRLIDPGMFPKIAWEFSGVRDKEELLAFNRKFGLLGHDRLVPSAKRCGGDPVAWSLGHARRVAGAFEIVSLIKCGSAVVTKELPNVLRTIGGGIRYDAEWPNNRKVSELEHKKWLAEFPGGKIPYWWPASPEPDPIRVAWRILAHLITDQISGLRVEISEETLRARVSFVAPLQAVYWSIANELEGLSVRRCIVCKTFFAAKRIDAEHCSDACRMKASRDRKKDKKRRRKHGLLQTR